MSENQASSKLKRRARGDAVPLTYMRGGKEIEDSGVKFLIAYKSGQYDVVGERSIFINEDDHETGTVYDKSKPYEVAILAKVKINLLS